MIAAPGVYGGKLCRSNISGANLAEYFININSDSTQIQSTRNWLEAKKHISDVPTINIDKSSQKSSCSWYFHTPFNLLKCYKRHFKMQIVIIFLESLEEYYKNLSYPNLHRKRNKNEVCIRNEVFKANKPQIQLGTLFFLTYLVLYKNLHFYASFLFYTHAYEAGSWSHFFQLKFYLYWQFDVDACEGRSCILMFLQ